MPLPITMPIVTAMAEPSESRRGSSALRATSGDEVMADTVREASCSHSRQSASDPRRKRPEAVRRLQRLRARCITLDRSDSWSRSPGTFVLLAEPLRSSEHWPSVWAARLMTWWWRSAAR